MILRENLVGVNEYYSCGRTFDKPSNLHWAVGLRLGRLRSARAVCVCLRQHNFAAAVPIAS